MPFEIIRNDITNMKVDAIVNTANPRPVIGSGTDSMVHEKAGPRLLQARQAIGDIAVGHAAITPAFDLPAKYVIHTVGPVWLDGSYEEETLLRSCYESALALAAEHKCRSIAFPLISAGNYGFPKDKALQIAISVFSRFLLEQDMKLYLVVFNKEVYRLSEKLFSGVASYIDEHYVEEKEREAYAYPQTLSLPSAPICSSACWEKDAVEESSTVCSPRTLEEALQAEDIGFSEALLQLIDKSGKKDPEVYKKANISKQHFSKIRNNPHYQPTKATALALALALELDLEQTKEFIGRAGYALTGSSKFDLIIQFFIQQKKYNVVEINMALYEFDQPLLGA